MASRLGVRLARSLGQRLQQIASRLMQYGGAPPAAHDEGPEKSSAQSAAVPQSTLKEAALADWFARVGEGAPQLLRPPDQGGTPTVRARTGRTPKPPRQQPPAFAPEAVKVAREPENVLPGEMHRVEHSREGFVSDSRGMVPWHRVRRLEEAEPDKGRRIPSHADDMPATGTRPAAHGEPKSSGQDSAEVPQGSKVRGEQSDVGATARITNGKPSDQPQLTQPDEHFGNRSPDLPLTMVGRAAPSFEWSPKPMRWPTLELDDSEATSFVSKSPERPEVVEFVARDSSRAPTESHGRTQAEPSAVLNLEAPRAELTPLREAGPWPELPEEPAPNLRHTVAAVLRDQRHRLDADLEQRGTWNV